MEANAQKGRDEASDGGMGEHFYPILGCQTGIPPMPERRVQGIWQVAEPYRRFVDETYLFWKPRLGVELTGEDIREIIENFRGVVKALLGGHHPEGASNPSKGPGQGQE